MGLLRGACWKSKGATPLPIVALTAPSAALLSLCVIVCTYLKDLAQLSWSGLGTWSVGRVWFGQ